MPYKKIRFYSYISAAILTAGFILYLVIIDYTRYGSITFEPKYLLGTLFFYAYIFISVFIFLCLSRIKDDVLRRLAYTVISCSSLVYALVHTLVLHGFIEPERLVFTVIGLLGIFSAIVLGIRAIVLGLEK